MKYRLFDGGYESFLDHRISDEYKDIVIDKLPQEIIDAEKEAMKPKPSLEDEVAGLKARMETVERALIKG